jgi:hypothetical protein
MNFQDAGMRHRGHVKIAGPSTCIWKASMNIPVFKNQSLIFSAARNPFVHFLKKRARREMIILIMIMVVIGKYILKLGLSIIISPGSLPMGNFPSQGQKNPTARKISPRTINVFCILTNASQNTSAYP